MSLVRLVISRQWYCRGLATVAGGGSEGGSGSGGGGEDATLPLKGIKVLDMTRVLAGVSNSFSFLFCFCLGGDEEEGDGLAAGQGIGERAR